ncbi:hypothetical protein AB9K41_05760, partial [Cribrihabitans sp. XS_ASV171]
MAADGEGGASGTFAWGALAGVAVLAALAALYSAGVFSPGAEEEAAPSDAVRTADAPETSASSEPEPTAPETSTRSEPEPVPAEPLARTGAEVAQTQPREPAAPEVPRTGPEIAAEPESGAAPQPLAETGAQLTEAAPEPAAPATPQPEPLARTGEELATPAEDAPDAVAAEDRTATGQTETAALSAPAETPAEAAQKAVPAPEPSQPQTEAEPPLEAPSLDQIYVEPDGTALLSGRAAPGAEVAILVNGEELHRFKSTGSFAEFLTIPFNDKAQGLVLRAEMAGRSALSDDYLIAALPAPPPAAPEQAATADLAPDAAQDPEPAAQTEEPREDVVAGVAESPA